MSFTDPTVEANRSRIINRLYNPPPVDPGSVSMGTSQQQNQQNFINALQQQMAGSGPSVAQEQLKQSLQQQQANALSQAASARGVNPGLAMRNAMQTGAQAQQAAAQSGAIARAQEQLGVEGQVGQQLESLSNQALQTQEANQRAQLQANLANQAAQMEGAKIFMGQENAQNAAGLGALGAVGAALLSDGGKVPGKAQVFGDSEKNDTVPAMLSPGEIVIPRSKSDDPDQSKEFIDQLMADKPKRSKQFTDVLKAHQALERRVAQLEQLKKKRTS